MTVLVVTPELLMSAAADVHGIGSALRAAHMAAAVPTTGLLTAGADEVSAAITSLFNDHAQLYQAMAAQAHAFHTQFAQLLGNAGPIYQAIEQANEKLIINVTNAVGQLEGPFATFLEQTFGPPVTPPVALPNPINAAVSLILSGTSRNVPPQSLLADIAQEYNLSGGVGAVWQPSQFFPVTPQLGHLTLGQSISQGVHYLDQAIHAEAGNTVTVWTTSQSSVVATDEIRHLLSIGSPFQDQLKFVLTGNPNNPDGGFFERLVGWYQPVLDAYLGGATPADSPYQTVIYSNEYDMAADFPQYILNPVSDLNSVMGFLLGAHSYSVIDLSGAIPAADVARLRWFDDVLHEPHAQPAVGDSAAVLRHVRQRDGGLATARLKGLGGHGLRQWELCQHSHAGSVL